MYSYCCVCSVLGILVGMRKVLLLWHSRGEGWGEVTMTSNCNIETSRILNAHLHHVQPRKKYLICCSSMTMIDSTICHHKFWTDSVATSTQQFWPCTISLSLIWPFGGGKGCGDTTAPLTKHLQYTKKTSGCRGGRETFTWWEYMFLFENGRRMLTKMETLTNSYAFSKAVVKYCENFTCPTWKSQNKNRTHSLLSGPFNLLQNYH